MAICNTETTQIQDVSVGDVMIVDLYRQGYSVDAICWKLDRERQNVLDVLVDASISLIIPYNKRAVCDEEKADWLTRYLIGETLENLSKMFRRGQTTIRKVLVGEGVYSVRYVSKPREYKTIRDCDWGNYTVCTIPRTREGRMWCGRCKTGDCEEEVLQSNADLFERWKRKRLRIEHADRARKLSRK